MEIYRDKILQKEGEDYTVVDNVVIFKKTFDPWEFVKRGELYFPVVIKEQYNCGTFRELGEPINNLPDGAILVQDPADDPLRSVYAKQ